MINCSENCIYCEDGLCNLETALTSSNTPTNDCPFYIKREKKDDTESKT